MNVKAIKTHAITKGESIERVLDKYVTDLEENSIVAVTSKIVSICEGRMVKIEDADKDKLIEEESTSYLPRNSNKYNVSFSIARNFLVAGAGIDESNGNGYYILWPKDLQKSANNIREHLQKKFGIKHLGVVITDSKTYPLRWGVTGFSIAHSGFKVLKNYMGTPDIFGRPFEYEQLNISDSLASAAVLEMGEGNEQTPIAIIENAPFVEYQDRNPTGKELEELRIKPEDDLYAPLLQGVKWRRGRK